MARCSPRRWLLQMDEGLFSHPGPRSAAAVEHLARFLQPEAWEDHK
jgi:hypothetical protein